MRRPRLLLVPLLLACGPGSSGGPGPGSGGDSDSAGVIEQPIRIRDQSGAIFDWNCDDIGVCMVGWIDGTSPPLPECDPSTMPMYGYLFLRFIEVTAACALDEDGALGVMPGWGRLVICDENDDCPQLDDYSERFLCRQGYCQNTDEPMGPPRKEDLELLCTGHAPRYQDIAPAPQLAAAIDAACPDSAQVPDAPCTSIPAGCDDPG